MIMMIVRLERTQKVAFSGEQNKIWVKFAALLGASAQDINENINALLRIWGKSNCWQVHKNSTGCACALEKNTADQNNLDSQSGNQWKQSLGVKARHLCMALSASAYLLQSAAWPFVLILRNEPKKLPQLAMKSPVRARLQSPKLCRSKRRNPPPRTRYF